MILKKDDYTISEDRQSITISQNALYRNLAECYAVACACLQSGKKDTAREWTIKAEQLLEIINLFDE